MLIKMYPKLTITIFTDIFFNHGDGGSRVTIHLEHQVCFFFDKHLCYFFFCLLISMDARLCVWQQQCHHRHSFKPTTGGSNHDTPGAGMYCLPTCPSFTPLCHLSSMLPVRYVPHCSWCIDLRMIWWFLLADHVVTSRLPFHTASGCIIAQLTQDCAIHWLHSKTRTNQYVWWCITTINRQAFLISTGLYFNHTKTLLFYGPHLMCSFFLYLWIM
jgi:hypothetical protein